MIDNLWRIVSVYSLHKIYDFFDKFKYFKDTVEKEEEKKMKVLRTYNGKELCGNELKELCNKCAIARINSTPYTSQINGVVEGINITLMEK